MCLFYRSLAAKQQLIDDLVGQRDRAIEQQEMMMSAQRVQAEHMNELEMALSIVKSSSEQSTGGEIHSLGFMGLVRRVKNSLVGRNIE